MLQMHKDAFFVQGCALLQYSANRKPLRQVAVSMCKGLGCMHKLMELTNIACSAGSFNRNAFRSAMSVVIASAVYLPNAQCFALVPGVTSLARSGHEDAAVVDYDAERQAVTVVAQRSYRYLIPLSAVDQHSVRS